MRKINCWNWCVLFLLAACTQGPKSTNSYFDFKGLVEDQIDQLIQRASVLDKSAEMGEEKSDSTFLPSVQGWTAELEIFRELDLINKPTYLNAFVMTDPVGDTKSNLKIRQYTSDGTPVPFVKFYYQEEFSRLKKIEASIREKNYLYSTQRWLVMEFDEVDGKPLLIRYSMDGFQKMVLSDTIKFSVHGQVDW